MGSALKSEKKMHSYSFHFASASSAEMLQCLDLFILSLENWQTCCGACHPTTAASVKMLSFAVSCEVLECDKPFKPMVQGCLTQSPKLVEE